jgi:glycosyltransferase involved in cell wall biosynthesis
MTRIAVITSSYPRYPGDTVAPFVKSICEHLAILGHEVEVVAPYDPAIKPFVTQNVPVHRFRYIWPESLHRMGHARSLENDMNLRFSSYLLLPFFLVASFFALLNLTARQRSQAIYAHWVLPNGLVAACVARVRHLPLVISLHGSDIFIARSKPIFRAITRWIFHNTVLVTACSEELGEWAKVLGAPENTRLIPWGADPDVFTPERQQPDQRKFLQINEDVVVIGSLGRFVHKKGFPYLIEAVSSIIEEFPNVRLVLGGDGALKENLTRDVKALGIESKVTFPGIIPWDQVPAFLANLDIFVLPSIRDPNGNVDGLPTVLLEAMSSGVAVIASDIGGTSLVIENGQNGLLVPSRDTVALAEAIKVLVENREKRKALGIAARHSILNQFNWEQVARTLSAYFDAFAMEQP